MAAWTRLGLRWSARITGLFLAGMALIFMVGEGPPNLFNQPPPVELEFLGMSLMLAGFLAGWRWAGAGGLLALLGFVIFAATELIVNGRPPGGAIPLFAVPCVLYLIDYGVEKSRAPADK